MIKLNAKQLRMSHQPFDYAQDRRSSAINQKLKRNEIYIILDNVLDTYNIGSIFRLADAVACQKVYLCGGSCTPPNSRIKKASINTTEFVEWEYCETALEAVRKCKMQSAKCKVIAIEQNQKSIPYDKYNYELPLALVVGNETTGVSKEVLDFCDAIVELPMFGVNISLNVMVSLGIVLYEVIKVKYQEVPLVDTRKIIG